MARFQYLFGVLLGECILSHTDNLSKTLQNPSLTSSEAQHIAALTCQTLERIRTDEAYNLFWEKVCLMQGKFNVSDPVLPRERQTPSRYDVGSSSIAHHPDTPKALYRQQCLDLHSYVSVLINQATSYLKISKICFLNQLKVKIITLNLSLLCVSIKMTLIHHV